MELKGDREGKSRVGRHQFGLARNSLCELDSAGVFGVWQQEQYRCVVKVGAVLVNEEVGQTLRKRWRNCRDDDDPSCLVL